ncbi:DNA repair protein RecN [Aquirufa aurantiipilula]|uniref:DNA repair protein RecN n=1 Tax=Aquirufa aurantiipilula TaxID=2696561 RepID=A0ABT6BGM6_9BACT|nr:DNA repair protein RecN [Aquirufa aurantiipilula]MDF5689419.1 DNA repair protein RecN [Aquirufa aurantiipilula]
MLRHLEVQNYALIDQLDLHLAEGLTVITGETGAGKSILLGAISLLLGQRADIKSLYDDQKKCVIEGTFSVAAYPHLKDIFQQEDIDFEDPCLIRREINPQGKSRSFINDTPVTLESMKRIGQELVDIHSQQDNGWMGHPDFALELVDDFAQNQVLKVGYEKAFKAFQIALQHQEQLAQKSKQGNQAIDFLQFQWDELDKAQLVEGEYEQLSEQLQRLQNSEQILEKLAQLANYISLSEASALEQIGQARQLSQSLSKWGQSFDQWNQRIQSLWIELKDLSAEVESEAESFQSDPIALEKCQKRLDLLNRLLQKYQTKDILGLIDLRNQFEEELAQFEHVDQALEEANLALIEAEKLTQEKAILLQKSRLESLDSIEAVLLASLQQLGMPNAQLAWEVQSTKLTKTGQDKIQLLFSANKGLAPKPFKQIASGGELSRLMLSIKHLLAQKRALPTLILDEIDTGVSGEIAIKMGQMLTQMSQNHQLIAITHLPQIAVTGQAHWFVYKNHEGEKTVSSIKTLVGEERIDEIAKMIGGQSGYVDLKENVRKLMKSNAS